MSSRQNSIILDVFLIPREVEDINIIDWVLDRLAKKKGMYQYTSRVPEADREILLLLHYQTQTVK